VTIDTSNEQAHNEFYEVVSYVQMYIFLASNGKGTNYEKQQQKKKKKLYLPSESH